MAVDFPHDEIVRRREFARVSNGMGQLPDKRADLSLEPGRVGVMMTVSVCLGVLSIAGVLAYQSQCLINEL